MDLLPAPFEWIDIPAGRVEMAGHGWCNVDKFRIAKYPITHVQFAPFMDAGGYQHKQWWTEAGWQARLQGLKFSPVIEGGEDEITRWWASVGAAALEQQPVDWHLKETRWQPTDQAWTEPLFWQDQRWNSANQPMVGVSWYEAYAYCQWLSDITGEQIMLPTEQQWQRAAQGDDGRVYPWGNDFDETRCNIAESQIDHTTPVTEYQNGASPFGVMGMCGNVEEWTCSDVDAHSVVDSATIHNHLRIALRGGSWHSFTRHATCHTRNADNPYKRSELWGFRIAAPSLSGS